jgi:hypothetical protein
MTKTRRDFTPEFKREAVALLESSGRPLMQIATELGISPLDAAQPAGGCERRPSSITGWFEGRDGQLRASGFSGRSGGGDCLSVP